MKRKPTLLVICLLFGSQMLAGDDLDSKQQAYLDERRALYEEREAIREAHSDDDPETQRAAINDWRDENFERFEELRGMAEALSRENEERTLSREAIAERIDRVAEMHISGDLAPEQQEFLAHRRTLYLEMLERKKEVADLTLAERREALRKWRLEEEDQFAELRELAEAASAEAASRPRHVTVPEEPVLPEGLSSWERDYLAQRHELYKERTELEEEYADASTDDLRAALEEWRRERSEEFEELRNLAEAMAAQ